ncbi:hypothetical protein H1Q58_15705 [Planococcus maritimus]|uniref:Uncharacterized protein n=1 Tax=Planococcus maritimus TaxID=192421 RepID=A0A7D7MEL6_PLAMR|nr:hypothetical protein [Planococcus maritimus]QMT17373.1 hypothetical protein H1Q58_15705 [Planococcus maritimus]
MSRSNKTSVFLGLLRKANPKPGGDYQNKAQKERRNDSTINPSLSTYMLNPGSDFPTSRQLTKEAKLSKHTQTNEISKPTGRKRVSRSNKTSAFLGLLRKANPKPGGDYQNEAPKERRNDSTSKFSLSSSKQKI